MAAVVFYLFPAIDPNFIVTNGYGNAVLVVLLFVLLNYILRRLFVALTLGIGYVAYYLSFGFLGLVANALVLYTIGYFFPNLLKVPNILSAFLGGLALAVVVFILGYSKEVSKKS